MGDKKGHLQVAEKYLHVKGILILFSYFFHI